MRARIVPRTRREDPSISSDTFSATRSGGLRERGARLVAKRSARPPRSSSAPDRAKWGRAAGLLAVGLVAARIAVVPITLSQDATYGPHAALTGDVRRFHSI